MWELKSPVFKISVTPIESYPPNPTPVLRCGERPPEDEDLYAAFEKRRRRAQRLARRVLKDLEDCPKRVDEK
jgi:hypothetical protein